MRFTYSVEMRCVSYLPAHVVMGIGMIQTPDGHSKHEKKTFKNMRKPV